jgi:hypothetical protein
MPCDTCTIRVDSASVAAPAAVPSARLGCSTHAVTRIYERFPRMRGMSRPALTRYLEAALPRAVTIGESVLVGQRFCEIRLGDGSPLVLVVAERPGENPCVVTAMTRDMAEHCGTMRRDPLLPGPVSRTGTGTRGLCLGGTSPDPNPITY